MGLEVPILVTLLVAGTGLATGILVPFLAFLFFQGARNVRQLQDRQAAMRESLGLSGTAEDMSGTLDGFDVRLVIAIATTTVTVRGLPPELTLLPGAAQQGLGHPDFDAAFRFSGPAGYLDAPARFVLGETRGELSIEQGTLRLTVDDYVSHPDRAAALLQQAVACARAVVGEDQLLHERTLAAARHDAFPAVRARMLDDLARGWPDVAEPLLHEALEDPEPCVRGVAARHLADRAVLVSLLGDDRVPVAVRLEALAALDPLEEGEAEPQLLSLLATGDRLAIASASRALAHAGTVRAVPALQAAEDLFSMALPRNAVRAIQARATGERGGLAVAPEGGALSVAPADRGRVSEAE